MKTTIKKFKNKKNLKFKNAKTAININKKKKLKN